MRDRDIDEAELQRLMSADDEPGEAAVDPRDVRALAALLATAAVPDGGETGPLPGEEAAVAAFRAAQPAARTRRRLDWLRPGRRERTVTFAMALAALLGSGVAVAAGVTGHMTLPHSFRHPRPVHSSTAPPSPSAPAPTPPSSDTDRHSSSRPQPEPTTTPPSSVRPAPTAKPPNPRRGPDPHAKEPEGPNGHGHGPKAHPTRQDGAHKPRGAAHRPDHPNTDGRRSHGNSAATTTADAPRAHRPSRIQPPDPPTTR